MGSEPSVMTAVDVPRNFSVGEEAVDRWIATAQPGQQLVYARGERLIRSAGVEALCRLQAEGEVTFKQRRLAPFDTAYIAERTARSVPARRAPPAIAYDDDPTDRVFRLLSRCANFKRACPSNSEIERTLGLPDGSASYRLDRLKKARLITVQTDGLGRRTVTIVASGKRTTVAK